VGAYQIAFFLGAATGSLLGGVLTDVLGYRQSMAILGGLSLGGALVALILLPETSQTRRSSVQRDTSIDSAKRKRDLPQLISGTVWYAVNRLVMAGIFVGTFGLLVNQSLGDSVDISGISLGVATITGIGLGLTTMLSMLAAPAAGSISDKLHTRWGVGVVGIALGIAGMIFISMGMPLVIILGLPLVAITSGSSQSLATALVGDLSPPAIHGRRLGILFTVGDLGSAIGPPLAFALMPLIGISGLYRFCAGLLVLILMLAILWTVALPRRTQTTVSLS
jgi:MFS family permease